MAGACPAASASAMPDTLASGATARGAQMTARATVSVQPMAHACASRASQARTAPLLDALTHARMPVIVWMVCASATKDSAVMTAPPRSVRMNAVAMVHAMPRKRMVPASNANVLKATLVMTAVWFVVLVIALAMVCARRAHACAAQASQAVIATPQHASMTAVSVVFASTPPALASKALMDGIALSRYALKTAMAMASATMASVIVS